MSLTATKIIRRVRRDLHDDSQSSQRWTDEFLVDYINDAQNDLRGRMPEYWLSSLGVLEDLVEANTLDLSTDLLLPDKLLRGVSSFVVYLCLSEDEADTENLNRAQAQRQQYEEITR